MKPLIFLLCLSLVWGLRISETDQQGNNKQPDNAAEVYQLPDDLMAGDDPASSNTDYVIGSPDDIFASVTEDDPSDGISSNNRNRNRPGRFNSDGTNSQEQLRQTIDPSACVVEGLWYNELGSELILHQEQDGNLTGEFRTAVEVECGDAGSTHSKVRGTVTGRLITFHTLWSSGSAITTWTGQCHRSCDLGFVNYKQTERIILHTTWTMTTLSESCDDSWQQHRFGQNIFSRKPIRKAGPRKSNDIHTPDRSDCRETGSGRAM